MGRAVPSTAETIIPWCRSPPRTPRPSPTGPADGCRPRRNGSSPPAGGLGDGAAWDEPFDPVSGWKANTWQGAFPATDLAVDGHHGAAPVASFPPNSYGLHDMLGNVWEHVADWWVPAHPDRPETDPAGPPEALAAHFSPPEIGAQRVMKGGSWLCAPSYCLRYRPSARQPAERGLGSNHIGFRIARDVD